jgi:uncharacterized membrane protein
MNPLTSVKGSLITGFVLAILFAVFAVDGGWNELGLARWLHIIAGITWIGLLYYFNFVQMPALAAAAKDQGGPGGAGISKYVAPRALLWFRWAAVATWLTGVSYLLHSGMFVPAFTLSGTGLNIGIGAWLGTIMLFNVWVFIWPNQKKVLGLVEATADQIAKARRVATHVSRINVVLSIPMLMSMAGPFAHTHAGFFL